MLRSSLEWWSCLLISFITWYVGGTFFFHNISYLILVTLITFRRGRVNLCFFCTCPNLQLNVDSILNALLSSFTGFGIAFTTNALIVECLRWRENRCLLPHIHSVTREQLRHSLHQYHQQHRPPPPQQQQSMENLLVEPMDGAGQVEMKIQT